MTTTSMVRHAWSAQFLGHPLVWLMVTMVMLVVAYGWISQSTVNISPEPVKKVKPADFPDGDLS